MEIDQGLRSNTATQPGFQPTAGGNSHFDSLRLRQAAHHCLSAAVASAPCRANHKHNVDSNRHVLGLLDDFINIATNRLTTTKARAPGTPRLRAVTEKMVTFVLTVESRQRNCERSTYQR